MHTYYIKKLFNLEGTIIKNSHFLKNKIVFDIEMPIVEHLCPNCGSNTSKIHDYYLRTVKDIPIQKKFVTIHFKELASVAKTYHNWAAEIRHSLEFSYSNGCIEGINNKIKTLKRLSFGMPNFIHFKARIMLLD